MLSKNYLKTILLITLICFSSFIYAYDNSDDYVIPNTLEQQLFFEAVQKGDIPQAEKYLETQRSLSSAYIVDRYNQTPFEDVVKKYPGQDVITNDDGSVYETYIYPDFVNKADHEKTGLMYAVSNRDIEMIKFLLSYGADVGKESGDIKHPLNPISAKHRIVYNQGPHIVFRPTITPFSCAIYNDYVDVVEIFTQHLYYNLYLQYKQRPVLGWNHGKYLQILETYYNLAKLINRTNVIEFFENTGYIISDLDEKVGKLTKYKIELYQKAFPSITQDIVDETITRHHIPNLYEHIANNRSFILYLKEYTDITFTIDHINTLLIRYLDNETLTYHIDADNMRFIMDTYNISADVNEFAVINFVQQKYLRDHSQSTAPIKEEKLLKMLFDMGFNPNNIKLREPAEFVLFYGNLYYSAFENYVYREQKAYTREQRLRESEKRKAELKAKKAAEKESKRLEKEARKIAKLEEKERKRLEKEAKKATEKLEKIS